PLRRQEQRVRRSADRDGVEILREEALEKGRRVGAPHGNDVTIHSGQNGWFHRDQLSVGARRAAAAAAVNNAWALLRHSSDSSAGDESATMPAPAWSVARPSRHTI